MIVDCHTHLQYSAGKAMSSEHLAMSEIVGGCIVLAENSGDSQHANSQLAQYTNAHSSKMVGFGTIKPTKDKVSAKGIESAITGLGLKGIVLYCSEEPFHPAHSKAMKLYENAQQMSLPIFFHNAKILSSDMVLEYSRPYLLDEIARTFKELKIIIGSMGAPFVEQTIAMVAKHPNVYADLTVDPNNIWQIYNILMSAYEHGVMDKLLFGSGYPGGSADKCIETLLGFKKLLGDTNLPTAPLSNIRNIVERDAFEILGFNSK